MPALRLGERDLRDQASRFGRIVVLDCGFQMLAERRRLSELPAEPAQKADRCLVGHTCNRTATPVEVGRASYETLGVVFGSGFAGAVGVGVGVRVGRFSFPHVPCFRRGSPAREAVRAQARR